MNILNKKIIELYTRNRKKYNYVVGNLIKNNLAKRIDFKISKSGWIIFNELDLESYNYLMNEINVTKDFKIFQNKIDDILLLPCNYFNEFFKSLKIDILKNEYITNYERHNLLEQVNYYLFNVR